MNECPVCGLDETKYDHTPCERAQQVEPYDPTDPDDPYIFREGPGVSTRGAIYWEWL